MCEICPQIHCVVENFDGTFSVQRYNHATKQYETINNFLTELEANNIKEELDADLQGE